MNVKGPVDSGGSLICLMELPNQLEATIISDRRRRADLPLQLARDMVQGGVEPERKRVDEMR